MIDILTNSLFDSRVHKTYGGKIVEERYSPPGLAAQLASKDLRPRIGRSRTYRCADAGCEPRP
jgi:3-hydroxyisobutyrate dehydrogenase-like beta-hydroxyacid dehydrogenase